LIPWFSLTASDPQDKRAPTLLAQLLTRWSADQLTELYSSLLLPVIESYFALVRRLGLQPELNAQNVLVGLNADGRSVAIVLRDCMGIEKDLTLRLERGLPTNFDSAPYKCISNAESTYTIRHSFGLDFKLCGYVLEPIVRHVATFLNQSPASIRDPLRTAIREELDGLPADYLPADGKWYRHPPQLLTDSRPYVAMDEPLYR
jgi:hypothetical protein